MKRMKDAMVPSERQYQLWEQYWCLMENWTEGHAGIDNLNEIPNESEVLEERIKHITWWENDVQAAIDDAREARKSKTDRFHILLTGIAVIAAVIASFNSCDYLTSSAQGSPQNTNESVPKLDDSYWDTFSNFTMDYPATEMPLQPVDEAYK